MFREGFWISLTLWIFSPISSQELRSACLKFIWKPIFFPKSKRKTFRNEIQWEAKTVNKSLFTPCWTRNWHLGFNRKVYCYYWNKKRKITSSVTSLPRSPAKSLKSLWSQLRREVSSHTWPPATRIIFLGFFVLPDPGSEGLEVPWLGGSFLVWITCEARTSSTICLAFSFISSGVTWK